MPLTVLNPLDARIPQWDLDQLNARRCPFCETDNCSVLMRPDKLTVAFCFTCGCWYVDRIPSVSDLSRFYGDYYCTHRPTDLSARNVNRMIEAACIEGEKNWQLNVLAGLLGGIKGKRIMDVGCGWGWFLLIARSAGAEVVGCDLSPEACEFANNMLGISVHQSELHKCLHSIGNVDAVLMRDFIEHSVEPMIDIKDAVNILKPGGLLLLHSPNGGEAGTDIETARKWVGFRVDLEHLQYMTSQTINWLARALDMRIERLDTFGFPSLSEIDELPNSSKGKPHRVKAMLREIATKIPGMRRSVQIMRAIKNEIMHEIDDSRLGAYHLFTVLRKREGFVGNKS